MAGQEELEILKQGIEAWNQWRKEHSGILQPDLMHVNLFRANLRGANFKGARLVGAHLGGADLRGALLHKADLAMVDLQLAQLIGVNLRRADLSSANLRHADLSRADLRKSQLRDADLTGATLSGADLTGAITQDTVFGSIDLSMVKGLEQVQQLGPSIIGIDTIYRSHALISEVFLRGAGVSESFITYMHSLVVSPIDYYACFISYSSRDQGFAERLYVDLQSKGVRCWFASEDMKIGDKIRSRIDESIRIYDKLLLILSQHSVLSKWVEYEVEAALDKEQEGKPPVLFPVRLDDTVMQSTTAWAAHIKRTRHIGDFTHWKNHDDYQKAFKRLLRDLKV